MRSTLPSHLARRMSVRASGSASRPSRVRRSRSRLTDPAARKATPRQATVRTAAVPTRTSGLKPWREIVTPHPDVASGRYQQAEFAADLGQVHRGEGTDEYKNPTEFFRRTFLTDGLKHLLVNALLRLSGKGGDPVVELQTNFGGGKTHSMLVSCPSGS